MIKLLCESRPWRRRLLLAALVIAGALSLLQSAVGKPNFVLVMADDLGYGDLGCYGSEEMPTESIDRLAAQGIRLTDYHSNGPVCSPTRAALLTGKYQQRTGVDGVVYADPKANRHEGLQLQERTLPELLADAGYTSGIAGKWHLGYRRKYNPTFQGFTSFHGFVSGNIDYHSHHDGIGVLDWWQDDAIADQPGYSTHLITRAACEFIAQYREQAFFLYVAQEAPHYPYQGPNDPPLRSEGVGARKGERSDKVGAYAEMIRELDRGVGEVIETLERFDLDDNTLVIFCSDNGAVPIGSNGQLRGHKGSLWEGGHRVPAIAYWPGKIAPGNSDELVLGMDWAPTICALADVSVADGAMDGFDVSEMLLHDQPLPPREVFWAYQGQRSMRSGRWKHATGLNGAEGDVLFDLEQDLGEQENLAAVHPNRVERMRRATETWLRDVARDATPQPPRP